MMKFHQLLTVAASLLVPPAIAGAAPPPPPPAYVDDLGKLPEGDDNSATGARLAGYLADDVREDVNGKLVASGKVEWMRRCASAAGRKGRLLSYSEGWKDGGSLMVVDEFDTVDRSHLPPTLLADPRADSRATLYQFGSDGKIHAIHTIVAPGFWVVRH